MEKEFLLPGESEVRKLIPDFDLLKINDVLKMSLRFGYQEEGRKRQSLEMELTFDYKTPSSTFLITLELMDIKKLSLPEMGTSMFELAELAIEKVEGGRPEGAAYRVIDHSDGILCYCASLRFASITPAE